MKRGEIFDKATLNSLLTSSLPRYFDFIDARAENPVSHKYVVANGTNILMASSNNIGHSSFTLTQNFVNELSFSNVAFKNSSH